MRRGVDGSIYLFLRINSSSHKRSSLSRISVRGILTDAHNEITYTQVEALKSMF